MCVKKLLISYLIACFVVGVLSLPFVPGPNGSALLLLIPLALSFLGPFTYLPIGQYIPALMAVVLFIIGLAGLFLAIYGFKKENANIMHAGTGLWAISGASMTVLGLIASCC